MIKSRQRLIFILFNIMFLILVMRIFVIQNSELAEMVNYQSENNELLGTTRGYIYDRNHQPLVNEDITLYVSGISDKSDTITASDKYIRNKNGIYYYEVNEDTNKCDEKSVTYSLFNRYLDENLCAHIIGYTDSEGYGISGIEKAFDKILNDNSGSIYLDYTVDGKGIALPGDGLRVVSDNYNSKAGLVLTIDKEIQKAAEKALNESEIECGAVVIMDVNTFEILGMVSRPVFNPNDLASSLKDENKPFINRALCAYPVGSVFKPFIAISALENGFGITDTFECTGQIKIGSNVFCCYNSKAHGTVDLNSAIEHSCNCYFINAALCIGAEKVCESISEFGFGDKNELCSELISSSGNFPTYKQITSREQLANLSFGQGELLATPLQIATAYSVLANGGDYTKAYLMKELVDDKLKVYGYYKNPQKEKIVDSEICELINICLYNNMINGTGVKGNPENVTAAGKTATAQTGIYENEEELLCTWFAGFIPYEKPQYVIVVFNEKGSTASSDCAPVFKDIADAVFPCK